MVLDKFTTTSARAVDARDIDTKIAEMVAQVKTCFLSIRGYSKDVKVQETGVHGSGLIQIHGMV
ncbi:MAG: hypothetical protein AAF958_04670, partial [Planctomycetota bacterium]